jgi:hypothetical protein
MSLKATVLGPASGDNQLLGFWFFGVWVPLPS